MTKYGSKVSFSLKPPRCTVIVFLLEPSQMFKKKHNNLEINLYSTGLHSIVTHIILVKADQHLNPLFQRTQSIAPTRCTHQNHCPFPSQHLAINPNFQGPSEGCRVKRMNPTMAILLASMNIYTESQRVSLFIQSSFARPNGVQFFYYPRGGERVVC